MQPAHGEASDGSAFQRPARTKMLGDYETAHSGGISTTVFRIEDGGIGCNGPVRRKLRLPIQSYDCVEVLRQTGTQANCCRRQEFVASASRVAVSCAAVPRGFDAALLFAKISASV